MKTPHRLLIAIFLAMLVSVPLVQTIAEARRGMRPTVLDVLIQAPTPANLRAFEQQLEKDSVAAHTLRPWMQAARFFALRDAGEKVLTGRDGWLFFQPGVNALTQRRRPDESSAADALAAVTHFRDALAARGIRLVVVPVPNKESIYPDRLTSRANPPDAVLSNVAGSDTHAFLAGCESAGIECLDLFAWFSEVREEGVPLYLAQDSHWSPAGIGIAADAIVTRLAGLGIMKSGNAIFEPHASPVARHGDMVQMLRSPVITQRLAPETVPTVQIRRRDTGTPYADDPASDVLILGDSFLRIYETDEPGSAGLIAHLALRLGRPLASIVNDGGASTLVRQELARRPKLLDGKKVVVWEFTERDLRLGTEGWQIIPLGSR